MKSALDELWRQLQTKQLFGVADSFSTLQSDRFLALYNGTQSSLMQELRRMADATSRYQEIYTIPRFQETIASLQHAPPAYDTILDAIRLTNRRLPEITGALSKSLDARAQILDQVVLSENLRHTFDRMN